MYPDKPNNNKQKASASIVAILAVVLLAVAVNVHNGRSSTSAITATSTPPTLQSSVSSSSSTPAPTVSNAPSSSLTSSGYKDGTYTASVTYRVPHGSEDIQVSLTVKNGVISDSSITNSEGDRESAAYQEDFASQYKSYVVGKNISGLQLSYVAGASDTTQGFDDALDKIRNEAQS